MSQWKTLSSRRVYGNPWMEVREDRVLRPDGSEGLHGVMSARGVSTGVVALGRSGELYLVGQYRYAIATYTWELIEGCSAPGESPLETARRELREEAGLVAHAWVPLGGEVHLSNSLTDERAYLFLAQELEQVGPPQPDEGELLELRTVPFEQAVEMAMRGELSDAMTVIGILRAARLRGGG